MPDIDSTTLVALGDTLQDVTLRANRLHEWVELELYVLKLVSSFEALNNEVRRAFGSGPQLNMANVDGDTWPRFVERWESCKDAWLDLEYWVGDVVYLNQPVVVGGGSVGPQLDTWFEELVQKREQIEQALVSYAAQPFWDGCHQFDTILRRRVILHRQRVKKEIGVLVEVTIQLRTRLEISLPTGPTDPSP